MYSDTNDVRVRLNLGLIDTKFPRGAVVEANWHFSILKSLMTR